MIGSMEYYHHKWPKTYKREVARPKTEMAAAWEIDQKYVSWEHCQLPNNSTKWMEMSYIVIQSLSMIKPLIDCLATFLTICCLTKILWENDKKLQPQIQWFRRRSDTTNRLLALKRKSLKTCSVFESALYRRWHLIRYSMWLRNINDIIMIGYLNIKWNFLMKFMNITTT